MLGRQGALADAAAGGLLPVLEELDRGVDEVLGVLGAHVLLREEGALQVDALDMGAGKLGTTLLVGLGNGGAGRTNVLRALRERGGQPGRGSATGQLGA